MYFTQLLKTVVLDQALIWDKEFVKDVHVIAFKFNFMTRKIEIAFSKPILNLSVDELRQYIEDENYIFAKLNGEE